ncbi:hypothetical protein K504DRAFT_385084 [Pleomassaria siparia CBS 279.74]|uniref:Uncharacterized protein n=1 Tax=Pleomassaria siparia CBS 279.74 TaxID=1314801 RepID=A0A6G1K199_9PLEO|nr:hypothetical protein K504DRAFT_385084 [Pleomassaria siparia CBS 279.74]
MVSSRFISLSALAALLSLVAADVNSTCYSYGVDFVDEESYFINTLSQDPFTCVSTFQGCNPSMAEVLLVEPNGDESFCSQLNTTADNIPELSTCPVLKSQMTSGDWIILVLGNNGDGNPFAWERDLYLDCGPQATVTVIPTVTYSITKTPTITSTITVTNTTTLGPTATVTLPSATKIQTITPKPVKTTTTYSYTKTKKIMSKELLITTKTVTASCTLPPKPSKPDKPCTYRPTLVNPSALATPTGKAHKFHRYSRKVDRAVDVEYARNRMESAKLKRDRKAGSVAPLIQERAPDAPTFTSTAAIPQNATTTMTAAPVTESAFSTTTYTLQLPPVTVLDGMLTSTTTLPAVTMTRRVVVYTTITTTKTLAATFTRTTTTTPSASATACKAFGGHIGAGRI